MLIALYLIHTNLDNWSELSPPTHDTGLQHTEIIKIRNHISYNTKQQHTKHYETSATEPPFNFLHSSVRGLELAHMKSGSLQEHGSNLC